MKTDFARDGKIEVAANYAVIREAFGLRRL
jgi:hypothetical protein